MSLKIHAVLKYDHVYIDMNMYIQLGLYVSNFICVKKGKFQIFDLAKVSI
ncbi:hypothetical protein J699_00856 [Acinetobacter sp. 1000160]|nr:hypothetical protein J522_0080 [Acinetobacter baumannii 146457]EYT22384.1 hypothetical protein J699_00856 [Acinetobacter sp. 1000160]